MSKEISRASIKLSNGYKVDIEGGPGHWDCPCCEDKFDNDIEILKEHIENNHKEVFDAV